MACPASGAAFRPTLAVCYTAVILSSDTERMMAVAETPKYRTLIPMFDELRGERVLLRPFRPEDAEAHAEAVMESREHLLPWLRWAATYESVDDSRDAIARFTARWLTRESLTVGLWEIATGRFLGGAHLGPDWTVPKFEIGYWLRASAAGRGYMTEAVRLFTDYAFASLDAKRVFIRCDARNTRSAAVSERLGFPREAHLRNDVVAYDGALRDTLIYAVTPDEWRARSGR